MYLDIEAPLDGILHGEVALQQVVWQRMIQNAILSIVSIRFSQVAAFDTEAPGVSEGR